MLGAASCGPEEQELELYEKLYQDLGGGMIDGERAANFLMQSGLPMEVLHSIWDLADSGDQGALNREQFFGALRLVAWAQNGHHPEPSLMSRLPPMLPDFALSPPKAGRPPSANSTPTRNSSPRSMEPIITAGATPAAEPFETGEGSRHRAWMEPPEDPFRTALGASGGASGGSAAASTPREMGRFDGTPAVDWEVPFDALAAPMQDPFDMPPDEGSRHQAWINTDPGEDPFSTAVPATTIATDTIVDTASTIRELSRRFDRTLAADREVSKQIGEEMEVLEKELRIVQDTAQQMEQQGAQEAQKHQRLLGEQKALTQRLTEQQHRLLELRDEGRALNLENLSMRSDRRHLSEEVSFLQQAVNQQRRSLENLEHMNRVFESFNKEMDAKAELLTRQRKELPVAKEQQLQRQEERQNNELRNLLERRKREQASFLASHHELQQKHQLVRAMQSDDITALSALRRTPPPEGHSWATSLLKGNKAVQS
ncbi:Epidermal growth factor receptor substrate 15 (Protein Eps15) (Protein AF-1p) [Durusdinium trenchii]|uniref:Epidermal growth factor receptor substrate 15 (Protein Eps15) (Protein AF-1p) n=1 Tax=Durusdinium trenchii TaxID=1381693 RepID=A0ABP0S1S4_9DINO